MRPVTYFPNKWIGAEREKPNEENHCAKLSLSTFQVDFGYVFMQVMLIRVYPTERLVSGPSPTICERILLAAIDCMVR
jgi:hypothetical protein